MSPGSKRIEFPAVGMLQATLRLNSRKGFTSRDLGGSVTLVSYSDFDTLPPFVDGDSPVVLI